MRAWMDYMTPNTALPRRAAADVYVVWLGAWLLYWTWAHPVIFPSPLEVLGALPRLWWEDGLGQELWTSFGVNTEALALSLALGLPLAYLSRVPAVRPLAVAAAELRFLSPALFFLVLVFALGSGHAVKVWMLALGETCFLVTALVDVMARIPAEQWDDARTLRMTEWTATWYVGVRGTLPAVLDAVRQNAAMGWAALMFVEGIVRSEGGVGVLLLNAEKHFEFAAVYAVAGAVLLVGLAQDAALGWLRHAACPWAQA